MSSFLLHGAGLRRYFVLFGILSLCLAASSLALAGEEKWGSHVELSAKAGNKRNLGKLNLFAPLVQDEDSLWFMDAKLVVGRSDGAGSSSVEGNLGLGYRDIYRGTARDGSGDYIWGAYGFYDHIRTESHNHFNQLTLGAELFTQDWDFRVNGYLPESNSEVVGTGTSSSIVISGTNISALTSNYEAKERALPGMDMEAGYSFQLDNGHRLSTHLGYFYFDRHNSPTIEGPRGRVDYIMDDVFNIKGSRLSLGLEAQTDGVRDDQYFATATIRIPLGKAPSSIRRSSIDRRMTESIVRDIDIVAFAQDINAPADSEYAPEIVSQQSESATNTNTGNTVDTIIYASSTGNGVGTEADPAGFSTADAIAKAGADGVIVLLDSVNTGGVTILQDGQTLVGAGGTLSLNSASGYAANMTFSGTTPTITNPNFVPYTIIASNGSSINGLNLSGAREGVYINNKSSVALSNLNIDVDYPTGTSRGVHILSGSSDITLNNVNVNSALGQNNVGVHIVDSSNVTMTGGSIQGVTSTAGAAYGALVYSSTDVVFDGVSIDTIAGSTDSLGIGSGGTASSVTMQNIDITGISDAGSGEAYGYVATSDGSSTTINDTNFHDYTGTGIYTVSNTMTVDGSGNTASGITTIYQNNGATVNGQISFDSPSTVVP